MKPHPSLEPTGRKLIENSNFRKHLTSGERSPKRQLQRRRSKISFAAAVTGNLCPAGVSEGAGGGEVRTLDEWAAQHIREINQPTKQHIGEIRKTRPTTISSVYI